MNMLLYIFLIMIHVFCVTKKTTHQLMHTLKELRLLNTNKIITLLFTTLTTTLGMEYIIPSISMLSRNEVADVLLRKNTSDVNPLQLAKFPRIAAFSNHSVVSSSLCFVGLIQVNLIPFV
jgi:hypothetical protein